MEKKSIVTQKERKSSKMEDCKIEEIEAGVQRNVKSEITVESTIVKTEILTESLTYEKSRIYGDSFKESSNAKINGELKLPAIGEVSGGDFARSELVKDCKLDSGVERRTTVPKVASGEYEALSVHNNSCGNRKVCKKRKIYNGSQGSSNYISAPNASQLHRASMLKDMQQKSTPLVHSFEPLLLGKLSSEICKENGKSVIFVANNKDFNNSSSPVKLTDSCSQETKLGVVDSHPEVNKSNIAEISKNDFKSSKNSNQCIKEKVPRKVTSSDRNFKNKLMKNLKHSVPDLVYYFENLRKSMPEPNSTNLKNEQKKFNFKKNKFQEKTEGDNKVPWTEKNDPKASMERQVNEDYGTESRSLDNNTAPLSNKLYGGTSSQPKEIPSLYANKNLKRHNTKELRFIFTENIPKNSSIFRCPRKRTFKSRLSTRNIHACDQSLACPEFGIKARLEIQNIKPNCACPENSADVIKKHSRCSMGNKTPYRENDQVSTFLSKMTDNEKKKIYLVRDEHSPCQENRRSIIFFKIVIFIVVLAASAKFLMGYI